MRVKSMIGVRLHIDSYCLKVHLILVLIGTVIKREEIKSYDKGASGDNV